MAHLLMIVLLSMFALIFAMISLAALYNVIIKTFHILDMMFSRLANIIAKLGRMSLFVFKKGAVFTGVVFNLLKLHVSRLFTMLASIEFDSQEPDLCFEAPIEPQPHWATVNRRNKHEEIFARLWPAKKHPTVQQGPKKTLLLTPPKKVIKKVIVEKFRVPKGSSNTEVAVDAVDSVKDEAHIVHSQVEEASFVESAFDEAHQRLISESYQDDVEPTFEIESLDLETVVNTTTTTNKASKSKKESVVDERDFQQFKSDVAKQAHCRWLDIFATYIGGDESSIWASERNTTCPNCGRAKKFYIVNSDTGASHCASMSCNFHCYDGFATIAAHTNEKYGKVVRKIGEDVGEVKVLKGTTLKPKKQFKESPPERTEMTTGEIKFLKMIMYKSKRLIKTSSPYKYLISRGIPESVIQSESQLFGMDELSYRDDDGNTGRYPALVVPISKGLDVIGYHRIYLDTDGNKLPFEEAKKPTGNYPGAYVGSCIKLGGSSMDDGIYRIAEGVETALAVTTIEGKPCWSTMTAVGIQNFIPPENAKEVIVYADLDKSKTGEIVSKKLHDRLIVEGIKCVVKLPNAAYWDKKTNPKGIDFLDILNIKQKKTETC